MKPLLLLVDLQNDFLDASGLEPSATEVVRHARRVLNDARARRVPVVHVVTSVDPDRDDRMPHWKALGRWRCVRGTPGHAPPPGLEPVAGEAVVSKSFFSAFSSRELEPALAASGADTLVVAGVHLHGCVRATVLDAYERGWVVWVADGAVGSDDPLHAAVTRRYLEGRAARFAPAEDVLGRLGAAAADGAGRWRDEAAAAAQAAREASVPWRAASQQERARPLVGLAQRLEAEAASLARQMAADLGKPVTQGEAEVRRTAELLRRAAALPEGGGRQPAGTASAYRRVPHGVVGVVTPWNNPLAIPWGKIGPALSLGNTVVWKPAPAAAALAARSLDAAREAGLPAGAVRLVSGDHGAAAAVMSDPGVDAVSLSGSSQAGWVAQEICGRRRIPLQAELGGNNAAIVWEGADLARAASLVAQGAFSFAGQRCTANRRAIVAAELFDEFLDRAARATTQLRWGDPLDPATHIGPLVSEAARTRVAAAVARAAAEGARLFTPHAATPRSPGAWFPPTLVTGAAHESAIVQDETFGPVLVLERADDFGQALALANGVRQGLVAALFSGPGPWRETFSRAAEAGILKVNASTADADADAPFGGWKASGVGPPEHGPGDVEFYTRLQAIYGGELP
jgi:acyl-CoA reductase-like NAD-dependent aldehyde dehydrogenase/nicotinamidase-related amidase